MSLPADRNALAFEFARICSLAAVKVMEVYNSDFDTRGKADRSPVTDADELAEAIILEALDKLVPGVPVLAEESFAAGLRPQTDGAFILVDPVDGTKEFINRNGEFTINIALVENRIPTAGCVFAPARERIFVGGTTAWAGPLEAGQPVSPDALEPIATRTVPASGPTAVMSRSHADEKTLAFADSVGVTEKVSARVLAEILPGGGRVGRRLSTLRPDLRMGYRCRPCRAPRCRRRSAYPGGRALPLRKERDRLSQRRLRRLGQAPLTPRGFARPSLPPASAENSTELCFWSCGRVCGMPAMCRDPVSARPEGWE